jgi:hypothetical protein
MEATMSESQDSAFDVTEKEQERFERLTGEGSHGVVSPEAPVKRRGSARRPGGKAAKTPDLSRKPAGRTARR